MSTQSISSSVHADIAYFTAKVEKHTLSTCQKIVCVGLFWLLGLPLVYWLHQDWQRDKALKSLEAIQLSPNDSEQSRAHQAAQGVLNRKKSEQTKEIVDRFNGIFGDWMNDSEFREKVVPLYLALAELDSGPFQKCKENKLFEFMPREHHHPEWFKREIDWAKVEAVQKAVEDLTKKMTGWAKEGSQICYIGTTKMSPANALREILLAEYKCPGEIVDMAGACVQNLWNIATFWDEVKIDNIQLKREVFGAAMLIRESFEPESFQVAVSFAQNQLMSDPKRFRQTLEAWKETRPKLTVAITPEQFRKDYFKNGLSDALIAYHDSMKKGFKPNGKAAADVLFRYGKLTIAPSTGRLILSKAARPKPISPTPPIIAASQALDVVPEELNASTSEESSSDSGSDGVLAPSGKESGSPQAAHLKAAVSAAVYEEAADQKAVDLQLLKGYIRMIAEDNDLANNIATKLLPPNIESLKVKKNRSDFLEFEISFQNQQETDVKTVRLSVPKSVKGKFDISNRIITFDDHQLIGKWLGNEVRLTSLEFSRPDRQDTITIKGKLNPLIGSERDFEESFPTERFNTHIESIEWGS